MSRPRPQISPGVALHITQRGVDRCATFLVDEDFAFYRWALQQAAAAADCAVHGYVMMTNHVHLLVTPSSASGAAELMMSLGRRYVRYFNDRYGRTGTLWEGRYRAAAVSSAAYLFACMRYIELNPVRAGLRSEPAAYEWSSHRHNACGDEDPIVTPHAQYRALGPGREARCAAYRALFTTELDVGVLATLRAAQRGRPALYRTPYQQAVEALRADPGSDHVAPAR